MQIFFQSKYRNISGYYLQCSVDSTWYCMTWALISLKQMQFIHMPIKLCMLCISHDWFNYPWNYWSGSSEIFILISSSVCCALHRVRIIFYSHSNSFIFAIKKRHARLLLSCYMIHVHWMMLFRIFSTTGIQSRSNKRSVVKIYSRYEQLFAKFQLTQTNFQYA